MASLRYKAAISLLIVSLGGGSQALSQSYSLNANPSNVGSIKVEIRDNAKDGCWTNLGESKQYATDKLRLKSYMVSEIDGNFIFSISVNGFRSNIGSCVANISIEIFRYADCDGLYCHYLIGEVAYVMISTTNVNEKVVSVIQSMVDVM